MLVLFPLDLTKQSVRSSGSSPPQGATRKSGQDRQRSGYGARFRREPSLSQGTALSSCPAFTYQSCSSRETTAQERMLRPVPHSAEFGPSILETAVLLSLKEQKKKISKKLPRKKPNLDPSVISKVNSEGRRKTSPPRIRVHLQSREGKTRSTRSPLPQGELKEHSFSWQLQPHQQRLQGDLQWDEEDMTNFTLHEEETLF